MTEPFASDSVEQGRCRNSENGISTFESQTGIEALLARNEGSIEPGLFLVGDRWIVSSEHPEDLMTAQSTMGGELWPADSPFYQ